MYRQLESNIAARVGKLGDKSLNIGLGLEGDETFCMSLKEWMMENLRAFNVKVHVYTHATGNPHPLQGSSSFEIHASSNPELRIIDDYLNGYLDAIIRGQLSSSKFLAYLKVKKEINHIYRIALLATWEGHDFFFFPVGIDEARDFQQKKIFVDYAMRFLKKLGMPLLFYFLSAGRSGDVGRDTSIKESIEGTATLVGNLEKRHPGAKFVHGEILIEGAISSNASVIVAPDGISGNLIYRTLIHLGGGHSHGAVYINPELDKPVLDTSRVGPVEEYAGAIILALNLLT
ncbi:MAG: methanogenesis marker protein Mmp4/MtxX [Promethearchaeota archaeon]